VTLTTRAHLEWHLIMGRLRCGLCGLFAKGARGLRMHQMESHGLEYEPAEAEAKAVSETQLIVFTASEARRERWGATAAAEAAARDAMDGGLECCRRGDLNGLRRFALFTCHCRKMSPLALVLTPILHRNTSSLLLLLQGCGGGLGRACC